MLVALVAPTHEARAQDVGPSSCPELTTIDQTRERIELLHENREAGIARLPTAQHQRLALESLYRWYWQRVARLDAQRRQVEGLCARAAQVRGDDGFTRVAQPPAQPAPDDPFAPMPVPAPTGRPQQPATYPPYARYPEPSTWDPFSDPPPPARVYPRQRVRTYPPYRRSR
jgi:hypothetical protein